MRTACKLSAVVICLNEEEKIGDCLDSLSFADEIVVIDSGSSDQTVSIVENKGARLIYNRWRGYVDQKNFGVAKATGDWILILDADERISESLKSEIISVLKNPTADGFSIPRLVWYLNRWIRYSGWYPARKIRLFKKDKGIHTGDDQLHEKVIVNGKVKQLNHDIYHLSFNNISAHLDTLNRFTEISANSRFESGKSTSVTSIFTRPIFTFLKSYFIKFGFRDGVAGFIIGSLSAYHVFCKYLKIKEKFK
ncbi:MAG: glycosyltransferase family 2 protein [Nitrospinota bacterium]